MNATGLFGAIKGAASRVSFDPLMWIVRMVLIAGFVLVAKKARGNPDWTDATIVCMLGSAALMAEYYMGGEMVRAWFDRAITRLLAAAAVYVVVLGYAALQWSGTASEMEAAKAGFQKAAFVTQEDTAKTEQALEKKVIRLEERLKMAPVRTAEAARADQEKAKAHRFWKSTNECKETKGAQTRQFCSEYASAVSDESMATEAKVSAEELKTAQKELADIRKERSHAGPAVVSGERADLRMLVKYAGMSEQAAMDLSAAWKIMIISFLACVLGMMIKAREYRGAPRKQWPIVAFVSRLLWGKNDPVGDLGNRNSEASAYPTDINPPRDTEPRINLAKVTQGDINREKLRAMLADLPSRMEAKAA